MAALGLPVKSRSVADLLLFALPLVVLIVPQGTLERTYVPELAFLGFLLLTVVATLAQACWQQPALVMRRSQFQPLLLVVLVFLLLLNPIWSLWQGNEPARVVMTVLPFVMMGVYYLIAMRRTSAHTLRTLIVMLALSGVALGLVVLVNYFAGSHSGPMMRSTGIEGERSLTLPLLPMGGVLVTSWALGARQGLLARLWGAAAVVMVLAIIMTVTRAMLLAYMIGAATAIFVMLRHGGASMRRLIGQRLLLGVMIVLALAAPLVAQWVERLDPTSEGDVGTILGRLDEYSAFFEAFAASPLLGKGMGYLATYPSDFDYVLRDNGITVCHSHLFFLAGTTGLLGMLLYYGVLVSGWFRLLGQVKRVAEQPDRLVLIAGMTGAVLAGVLFTLTSTTFTALSYNLFLGVFLICARTDWGSA